MEDSRLQNTGTLLIAIAGILMVVTGMGVVGENRTLRTGVLLAAIGFAAAGTLYLVGFVRSRRKTSRRQGD
jgi:hypothetical protein